MQYSKETLDHYNSPRNRGTMESPDGVGEVGNPVCGDMMTIMIKVSDDRITDIKFQTLGCGAATAASSVVTEMAKGKTLSEAMKITDEDVARELGGLPKNKLHCSNLGADALQKAIMDYLDRKEGRVKKTRGGKVDHMEMHEEKCYCPYCQTRVPEEAPYCANCGKPNVQQ